MSLAPIPPPPPLTRRARPHPPSRPSGQRPPAPPPVPVGFTPAVYVWTPPAQVSLARQVAHVVWIVVKVIAWTFAIVFMMNLLFGLLTGASQRRRGGWF